MYAGRIVTPSRVCELKLKMRPNLPELILSHPHGCVSWNNLSERESRLLSVTPSRVCELKLLFRYSNYITQCHTLTGVWVEILELIKELDFLMSHPHGCVSWNDLNTWFEVGELRVTPSRVCELKSCPTIPRITHTSSHPHGCVSWNL